MTKLIAEVKWAIRHIAWWHSTADFPEGWPDVTPWKQWEGSLAYAPLAAPRWLPERAPHQLEEEGSTMVCSSCGRWARTAQGKAKLARGRCLPLAPFDAKKKGNLVLWHDHVLMLTGNTFLWCLRCGRWADKLTRHLRTETCKGEPTPKTEMRYKSLCQGRHPKPPHHEVGQVRPLQLEAWPHWCRRADAQQAVEMPARSVAPLLPVGGLQVVLPLDGLVQGSQVPQHLGEAVWCSVV